MSELIQMAQWLKRLKWMKAGASGISTRKLSLYLMRIQVEFMVPQ